MTFTYNDVYIQDTATVAGPYEKKGPLKRYFDKTFDNLYYDEESWEKAEIKSVKESLKLLYKKAGLKRKEVDVILGGDLQNQIAATTYGAYNFSKCFLGLYGACSTSVEAMIIGSILIESKKVKNAIATVSSHNMSAEKQFRNPTEYGAPKPKSATFTSTGSASILLTKEKTDIKVESSTIGQIIDLNQNDPNDMGKVMAPAAIDTIKRHLKDLNRKPDYYDLIVTGDLGVYGKEILKDYMSEEYDINLEDNYNDCGVMLYDLTKQKECLAGGSGPVCSALVSFGYIYHEMKKKNLKKVLIVATGALFSPTMVYQKENIYSIANAISLEVV
ncbi:MAG: stage V sporulation protein AD [bacterium]|nr:stage V sporulation protein AD [bacterium]